jgi:hypothetical protein
MTMVALGLLLGMAGLLWVMVIDIAQTNHKTKNQRSHNLDVPVAEAIRPAGRSYSQSGTGVLNQKTIVPEAPQFLRHFYFLRSSMNVGK